jgi:hypothetical protein
MKAKQSVSFPPFRLLRIIISLYAFLVFIGRPAVAEIKQNGDLFVSYVLYAPDDKKAKNWCVDCLKNVDIFVSRGVVRDDRISFLFTLVGERTRATSLLNDTSIRYPNVKVRRYPHDVITDLHVHGTVMKEQLTMASTPPSYFILLNCGARGPYYQMSTRDASIQWALSFTSLLKGSLAAVGPTISCAKGAHIQTYAMALNTNAARLLADHWTDPGIMKLKSKHAIIAKAEIGASQLLLKKGYNIASLDSRFAGRDFRRTIIIIESSLSPRRHDSRNGKKADKTESSALLNASSTTIDSTKVIAATVDSSRTPELCDPEYHSVGYAKMNPTICWGKDLYTPGCQGLEPCEVMFVKTGGDALRHKVLSTMTMNRVAIEDSLATIQAAVTDDAAAVPPSPSSSLPSSSARHMSDLSVVSDYSVTGAGGKMCVHPYAKARTFTSIKTLFEKSQLNSINEDLTLSNTASNKKNDVTDRNVTQLAVLLYASSSSVQSVIDIIYDAAAGVAAAANNKLENSINMRNITVIIVLENFETDSTGMAYYLSHSRGSSSDAPTTTCHDNFFLKSNS